MKNHISKSKYHHRKQTHQDRGCGPLYILGGDSDGSKRVSSSGHTDSGLISQKSLCRPGDLGSCCCCPRSQGPEGTCHGWMWTETQPCALLTLLPTFLEGAPLRKLLSPVQSGLPSSRASPAGQDEGELPWVLCCGLAPG